MRKGSKHSEQTKQKMREKKLGTKQSEQTKQKISKSMKEYCKKSNRSEMFKEIYSILKERTKEENKK